MSKQTDGIGCAVIGYGAMHNFGRMHSLWIDESPKLTLKAICDQDPDRLKKAGGDFPAVKLYSTTQDLYRDPEVRMVTLVTPNYTHRRLAVEAFENGRHVLTENAMCLNVAEASEMIEAAEKAGKMLCVHHNRRHDGNYRLIREIIASGEIGEVFQVELSPVHYGNPFAGSGDTWWADRNRSGGSFFYYGPQAIDWLLDLVPHPIVNVTGFTQKLVWHEMTNEDQVRAVIRFENGAVADFMESHIDCTPRPFWRILGTKGAIVDTGKDATKGYQEQIKSPSTGSLTVIRATETGLQEESRPYKDSDWHMFYRDIADHLLEGAPVPITGECGRRVIGVLETAKKSAEKGRSEEVPYK